jgi:hypothetical protein
MQRVWATFRSLDRVDRHENTLWLPKISSVLAQTRRWATLRRHDRPFEPARRLARRTVQIACCSRSRGGFSPPAASRPEAVRTSKAQAAHCGSADLRLAESARGVSPRAAHRSVRETLASYGSCHPPKAAASHRNPWAHPVSRWLTGPDAGDPLPSLHGHYPTSSLLRRSPPLADASVLSTSWFSHLCLFPSHRRSGSCSSTREPASDSRRLYAGCYPPSNQVADGLVPEDRAAPGFSNFYTAFDATSTVHLRSSLGCSPARIFLRTF